MESSTARSINEELETLAHILARRSYLVAPPGQPFILSSGKESDHYFDCELTTTYALALPLIARAFYDRLLPGVVGVGGPTRGADPIADAIAYYSAMVKNPVSVFSIRKELKAHGTPRWIEGSWQPGDKVAFVDDVVTSGRSVADNVQRCRDAGLEVVQILVLIDREENRGMERVRDAAGGIPVEAIFRYSEIMKVVKNLQAAEG